MGNYGRRGACCGRIAFGRTNFSEKFMLKPAVEALAGPAMRPHQTMNCISEGNYGRDGNYGRQAGGAPLY